MPNQGSYAVGGLGDPGGYDGWYATWKAALAAVSSPLAGDLTFTQVGDTTETGLAGNALTSLAGHTLKLTSDTPPNGDPSVGHVTYFNHSAYGIKLWSYSGVQGVIEVENLHLIRDASAVGDNFIWVSGYNNGHVTLIHDNLCDDDGHSCYGIQVTRQSGLPIARIWNNCIYGGTHERGIAVYGHGVWNTMIENNVVIAANRGFYIGDSDEETAITRNNVSIGGAEPYAILTDTYTRVTHCATSAASIKGGIKSQTGVTTGDFLSTSPASPDFLKPNPAGKLAGTGIAETDISENTEGVRNTKRPNAGVVDIGAVQNPTTTQEFQSASSLKLAGIKGVAVSPTEKLPLWKEKPGDVAWTATPSETWLKVSPPNGTLTDVTPNVELEAYADLVGKAAGTYNATIDLVSSDVLVSPVIVNVELKVVQEGVDAPNRPTASVKSVEDRVVTVTIDGTADVFRIELLDMMGQLVTFGERVSPGDIAITVPVKGVNYLIVSLAGNYGSTSWSLPGPVFLVYVAAATPEGDDVSGVGLVQEPSDAVKQAGALGSGLRFPFRFSEATGAPEVSYGKEHVMEGMRQILGTRIGGRIIRRDFGSGITSGLMKPDTMINVTLSSQIRSALARWEKRIQVTELVMTADREKGRLDVDIKFLIFKTHQAGNLVWPYSYG